MLQTNTVSKYTLELLTKICSQQEFKNFHLVGGTALALQLGHRISIDLDFFINHDFDEKQLGKILINDFDAQISNLNNNAITGNINNVKFDFIAHQYTELDSKFISNKIRLASLKDIAAMKLNAVRNRGTKKDFVDIYFLLQHFTLSEMLNFTNQKYPNHVDILTLKSLVYFDDAELQPDCEMLIKVTWEEVKEKIKQVTLPLL